MPLFNSLVLGNLREYRHKSHRQKVDFLHYTFVADRVGLEFTENIAALQLD